MRLGAHHPVADKCAWPEIIPQVAVEAERIRLDSVWSGPGYYAAQFYPTRYTSATRPLVLEPPKSRPLNHLDR